MALPASVVDAWEKKNINSIDGEDCGLALDIVNNTTVFTTIFHGSR
jgi:hypothetical protein